MIHRKAFEDDLSYVFDEYGYGTTIWSPLAGGLLSGKYIKELNDKTRFDSLGAHVKDMLHFDEYFGPKNIEKTKVMFKELEETAKELGGSLP